MSVKENNFRNHRRETIEKNRDCELIYQNQKGYENALRLGIKNVDTDYSYLMLMVL